MEMAKIYRFDGTAALKQEVRRHPDFKIVEHRETDSQQEIGIDEVMHSISGFPLCDTKKDFRFAAVVGFLAVAALFILSFAPLYQ